MKIKFLAVILLSSLAGLFLGGCASVSNSFDHSIVNGMEIKLTTIFTNDLTQMKAFFNQKMGLPIASESLEFIEFDMGEYRFAVGTRESMYKTLKDSTYLGERKGAAVGIGFYLSSKEKVDSLYEKMKNNGITFIQDPKLMPWNEYTAFFKDPDGNVHELVSTK